MNQGTDTLAYRAVGMLAQTTGMNVTYQANRPGKENKYPDGLIRVNHQDLQWDFAVQARKKINRPAVAMEKIQPTRPPEDRILVTTYVAPPMADLMRQIKINFIDLAGNAYINKPPLFVFIKGNRPPEEVKGTSIRRLFKPAGLKVVFALLNEPDMANRPYRQVAAMADVALGTVDWVFRDLREMGFLLEMGRRKRKLTNLIALLKRWVEAYPDQLRPKLVIDRFNADDPEWWKTVNLLDYDMCWGGEVAAAKLTRHLKPGKVVIYGKELPGKLIIRNKLRKADRGTIEILKPFWRFDQTLAGQGIAPPLLIYADLMATGDDRNIETAGIIYDNYLAQLDREDR